MYRREKELRRAENDRLLSYAEMMTALELMVHRLDAVDAACSNGFPLYSRGNADKWIVSPGGSWVGGFWSGCWWLRSRLTESALDRRKAADICQRLSPKIAANSVNRSMIFWYGAALGDLWLGDADARALVRESIDALAASYDPEKRCIPLGTDMGGGKDGNRRITIDTLASLIQLFSRGERSEHEDLSRRHADTLLAACRTEAGAFHDAACFDQGVFRPADQAGAWSRGQAWAMLGLSRAAAQWGEPYLTYTRSACEYWRRSRAAYLPENRLNHPAGICDPSSAVIASLAMLALAELVVDGDQWRTYAHQRITAIIRSRYFTGFQKQGGSVAEGIFWGGCYKTQDKEELVETAWSSFLLMTALGVLVDAIEPSQC